jgi:hypothetical protein
MRRLSEMILSDPDQYMQGGYVPLAALGDQKGRDFGIMQ